MKASLFCKAIILLLVLSMIPFAACRGNGDGNGVEETKTVSLPIASFSVVRPVFTTVETVKACDAIAARLNEKLGENKVKVTTDKNDADSAAYEIIVGATKRQESVSALEELRAKSDSMHYMIRLSGNKIVIIGSDDHASVVGAQAFCEKLASEYVNGQNIVLTEGYYFLSNALDSVEFIKNGKINYTLVRPADAPEVFTDLITNFRTKIVNMTGISAFSYTTDYIRAGQEHDADAYEILVGDTNYNETKTVKDEFGGMGYGVRVIGNKIVVFAPSPARLEILLNDLVNLISSSMTGNRGSDNVNVRFICESVKQYTEFGGNVPALDGAVLKNASYAEETDTYTLQYSNATAEHFNAYRAKLEGAGYAMTQENKIGDNLYATYKSDKYRVHFYYTAPRNIIHVVVMKAKDIELPTVAEPYEKICEPSVTQLANLNIDGYPGGMGYIFRLEDSTFIVVDGGNSVGNEKTNLYNKLKELNKRPDGKIIIRSWFITHGHVDHYNILRNFDYTGAVTIENVVGNYISADYRDYCDSPTYWDYRQEVHSIGSKYVNVHTGQQIAYAGAKVTVYFTCVDLLPTWKIRTLNDTCLAFMVEIGGQKIFIGADVETLASDTIASMYRAEDLKCDFMQVCHHGYYGGSTALYGKLDPSVILWPAATSFANSQKGIEVNAYLLNNLNVKEIYIAGDGDTTFELPYTPKQK